MVQLLLAFFIWAILHSVTAAPFFKRFAAQVCGDHIYQGFYRLFYSAVSVVTLIPIGLIYIGLPDGPFWQLSAPLSYLLYLLQLAGVLGVIASVLQTRALSFVGIQQAADYFSGKTTFATAGLGEVLYVEGLYKWMRHPLYTFSMLFLWASPTVTRNYFILAAIITLYFIIGSAFEERRMRQDFGEAYMQYQQRVPRFIPLPWRIS